MATTRVLSREDGNLNTISLVTSRNRAFKDIDLTFTAKPNGEIFKKTDAAAVKQSIKNLLQTDFYEKPFLPFYGGNLRSFLFELAYDDVEDDIRQNVIAAIEKYEPRALVLNVDSTAFPDNNSLAVTVEFQVINTTETIRFTTSISRLR
jgi:phage baseplate assembly protein W